MCEIHSLYIQLHDIPAGRTLNVQGAIQIESRAELFDWCLRQDDLSFCEKLIKYNFKKIPVSSFYIPQEPIADVLIIKDNSITRKEFVFRHKALLWDAVRYNGVSVDESANARHPTS